METLTPWVAVMIRAAEFKSQKCPRDQPFLRAMSTEPPLPDPEGGLKKRRVIRPWFLAVVLGMAAVVGWLAWPANESGLSAFDLSRADGRPRFYATTYPRREAMRAPRNFTPMQRLFWAWMNYKQRYGKRNPAAYTFPASPVQFCSIAGLLNQCMEVSGTRYLIAVEIAGGVEFGNTNTLNGAQWVAAFERALETSDPVLCYDYTKKRNFQDTLMLIRERPGVVKVVPRSKLAEYQKAGLVKPGSR